MKKNYAFTVVELAVVVAIFLIMLMALAPFVKIAKDRKNRINCADNVMQISLALHSYAADHDGAFPPVLGDLYPAYITDEKVFDCQASKVAGIKDRPDYNYTAGLTELSPPTTIVVQDNDSNHKKAGRNILRINGSVEWVGRVR